jgi:hypothetical protein
MTIKNAVFWDITPCGSCENRRYIGTQRLHHQGDKNQRAIAFLWSICQSLVTANVPISPIFVTLMMEALRSSETSVLTRAKWQNIPENHILHNPNIVSKELFIWWLDYVPSMENLLNRFHNSGMKWAYKENLSIGSQNIKNKVWTEIIIISSKTALFVP